MNYSFAALTSSAVVVEKRIEILAYRIISSLSNFFFKDTKCGLVISHFGEYLGSKIDILIIHHICLFGNLQRYVGIIQTFCLTPIF